MNQPISQEVKHTRLDIEDFDVWQDEHHHVTADKQTYQMLRDIAVNFANAMLDKSAFDDTLSALKALLEDSKEFHNTPEAEELKSGSHTNCGWCLAMDAIAKAEVRP